MVNILEVADKADLIINGYAFTRDGIFFRVLNLNEPDNASVLNEKAEVIETSMDDIEIAIILDYFKKNRKYMEA